MSASRGDGGLQVADGSAGPGNPVNTASAGSAADLAATADAEVIVVGPAPPLRGGIAAHTAGLVEWLRDRGKRAVAISYRRLYPSFAFPGTSQRIAAATADGNPARNPEWSSEMLDVISPRSWWELRRVLAASNATIVLQWWHPVAAPALLAATRGLERSRLVAVCHNALPHERVPGSAMAARRVLGLCARVVCHSEAESGVVAGLLGGRRDNIFRAALPCLVTCAAAATAPAELAALPRGARILTSAGHLRAYKATAVLLKAWTEATRPPEARLVIVGESYLRGRERREVAELADRDPSIVLVDRYVSDEDLVYFLASSEALVAAHVRASQSGMIPLARRLGLPCIVSDAGGLAEQAGSGSAVVRAGRVADLSAAIERQLSITSPRIDCGQMSDRKPEVSFRADWRPVVEAMGIGCRP